MSSGYLKLILGISTSFLLIYAAKPLWLAMVLSIFVYLLLNPVKTRLQAHGLPTNRAIFATLALPLTIAGGLLSYGVILTSIYIPTLNQDLLALQQTAINALTPIEKELGQMTNLSFGLSRYLETINVAELFAYDKVLERSGFIVSILLNLALWPLLSYFLLRDFRPLRDRLLALLPNKQFELGWLIYQRLSVRMQAYLQGLFIQQIILATITSVGFWIAGFPSPILLGILTGIAGLIPYLGPPLALIAPCLMMLTTGTFTLDELINAVIVLAVGFGFDNLVVMPFFVAGAVNLHPAIAFTAVIIAGHIGGIPAMVVVIPLLGMARIMIETIYHGLRPAQ